MKFKADLDYFQNMRAWQDYEDRHFEQRTAYNALSAEEHRWLMALNEKLRQLEAQYFLILKAKEAALQARVADPDDWVLDFNLDLFITFYLRKDDFEYEEWDDNILMKILEYGINSDEPDWDWGFGATDTNHCESLEAYEGEHHCWLFHTLYDHCHLDWRDLLRIGEIGMDLKIEEQSGMLPADCALPERNAGARRSSE